MSFRSVKATQPELDRFKAKANFLTKGESLLEIKRTQLFDAIKKLSSEFFKLRKDVLNMIQIDFKTLKKCYEIFGKEKITILAEINKNTMKSAVDVKFVNNLGIDVPRIKFQYKEDLLPVYSFTDTPLHLDYLVKHLRETLNHIIKLAELNHILFDFSQNYKKIQRRINALDDFILPRLKQDIIRITEILEDMEQEEFVQLKKIKEILEKTQ